MHFTSDTEPVVARVDLGDGFRKGTISSKSVHVTLTREDFDLVRASVDATGVSRLSDLFNALLFVAPA